MHLHMLIAFVAYFTALFLIALAAYWRGGVHGDDDNSGFLLGNRSINYWLTALSAHASDMSDWLFMSYPGAIFAAGLSSMWMAVGLFVCMFLNWQLVAPRLRDKTALLGATTLSSFFEKRSGDTSGYVRLLSACASLFFFTIYVSAGFKGVGIVCASAFNMDYRIGVFFGLFIVLAYTFLGGFVAVAWTDAFQALFLLAMIILVPLVAVSRLGGVSAVFGALPSRSLSFLPGGSFVNLSDRLLLAFGWGLGYFGQPHILTKFMGISDGKQLHKSKYLGMTWQLFALLAATMVGLVGSVYFRAGLTNNEYVFVEMVKGLFNPLFAGFVLCAILVATISTIDSQVLVLASSLTNDFYKRWFRPLATSNEMLQIYRASIVFVCFASSLIAFDETRTIYSLVWYAWTGLGCCFGPLVLVSLYAKRLSVRGALSSIIAAGLVSALWHPVLGAFVGFAGIPAMLPGFAVSLLCLVFL